jgi:hypothetical protein
MDSTSQTAADDTFDIVGVNRGKETIKKLVVQLKEKIKELETNKESIQVFEFIFIFLNQKWVDGKTANKNYLL